MAKRLIMDKLVRSIKFPMFFDTEKLKNEIQGHELYLSSDEIWSNKASEHQEFQQIMSDIHDLQRKELFKMKNEKTYTDEAIRKAEHILDINDMRVAESAI